MSESAPSSETKDGLPTELKPAGSGSNSPRTPTPFEPPSEWRIWALIAVLVWFALFTIGALIDSAPYREALGWEKESKATKVENKVNQQITDLDKELKGLKESRPMIMADPGKDISEIKRELIEVKTQIVELSSKLSNSAPKAASESFLTNFLTAAFTFMPLNVGLLCILAAFIGGCSVNKEKIWTVHFQRDSLPAEGAEQERFSLTRQLLYLTEHPSYSAVRGLIVYLVLISGFFIVGPETLANDPEQLDVFSQYIKFAGLSSFFGYLAGYDPTLFSTLINLGSSRLRLPQGGK